MWKHAKLQKQAGNRVGIWQPDRVVAWQKDLRVDGVLRIEQGLVFPSVFVVNTAGVRNSLIAILGLQSVGRKNNHEWNLWTFLWGAFSSLAIAFGNCWVSFLILWFRFISWLVVSYYTCLSKHCHKTFRNMNLSAHFTTSPFLAEMKHWRLGTGTGPVRVASNMTCVRYEFQLQHKIRDVLGHECVRHFGNLHM